MPSKKKRTEAEEAKDNFARGAQLTPDLKHEVCGHINKQFFNFKGQREDLPCTLPKGHTGDHFAPFQHNVTDYAIEEMPNGMKVQVASGSHLEDDEAWWSDAAGEYPKPTITTPEEDFKRLKEARARERGTDEALSDKIDGEVRKTFGG